VAYLYSITKKCAERAAVIAERCCDRQHVLYRILGSAQDHSLPDAQNLFLQLAVRRNLTISAGFRPWRFKDRPPVEPEVAAFRPAPPEGWTVLATVDTLTIAAAPPGNEYAAVTGADGMRSVCIATGIAGDMRVVCDSPEGGTLSVKEYT
jgi:hypothetical protein